MVISKLHLQQYKTYTVYINFLKCILFITIEPKRTCVAHRTNINYAPFIPYTIYMHNIYNKSTYIQCIS